MNGLENTMWAKFKLNGTYAVGTSGSNDDAGGTGPAAIMTQVIAAVTGGDFTISGTDPITIQYGTGGATITADRTDSTNDNPGYWRIP